MRTRSSIVVGMAFLLAGCAIHPLPEDVTKQPTYLIVQKIRCEAREALINISVHYLRRSTDQRTRELADLVEQRQLKITDLFEPRSRFRQQIDRGVQRYFETFALTTVAFGFNFDMTEFNDYKLDTNFKKLFSTGAFTLGASVGSRFDRQNTRDFQVGDTFLELYEHLDPDDCMDIAAGRGNYIYPITGKIGLEEVFHTFIRLNIRELDRIPPPPVRKKEEAEANKFTETLLFTTTINASVTPKVTLDAVSDNRFRLADASVPLGTERKDAHKLVIAVIPGLPVDSLADARAKAYGQKQKAFNQLNVKRTEEFFDTQKQIFRMLQTR